MARKRKDSEPVTRGGGPRTRGDTQPMGPSTAGADPSAMRLSPESVARMGDEGVDHTVPNGDLIPDVLVGATAETAPSYVDIDTAAIEAVDAPEVDRAKAIAIGLLLGAAVGLVIDAILSRFLFQGG